MRQWRPDPRQLTASTLAPLLAALAMLGPFSIDTFFPAFAGMAADLGVSAIAMQQTISVYLAAYALMSLFHGPLSDAYGRRPVILTASALFALASVGCAFSANYEMLLFFRACQGLAAGAGVIVGRAMIRDRFHGADAQKLMSQVSLIFAAAPALAPVLGGYLLMLGSWRSIFAVLGVFALGVWLWCWRALAETHPPPVRQPLSLKSLAQIYGTMLRDPVYVALSLVVAGNFGGLFAYIASAPIFVMEHLKLNAQQFAWLFFPAIGGMMLGAVISGRVAGTRSPAQTMALAYQCVLIGVLSNLAVSVFLPPSLPWSVLPLVVLSMGIAIAFPTVTLLMLDRYPNHRGAASSLQSTVVLASNAILAGVTVPLIAHSVQSLALYAAASIAVGYGGWRFAKPRLHRRNAAVNATLPPEHIGV